MRNGVLLAILDSFTNKIAAEVLSPERAEDIAGLLNKYATEVRELAKDNQ